MNVMEDEHSSEADSASICSDFAPEPMDADTYRKIDDFFNRRGLDSVARLRQDFARNKIVWTGEWHADLWYFMINVNPVLAMCCSHKLHPIGRFERFFVNVVAIIVVLRTAINARFNFICYDCGLQDCVVPELAARSSFSLLVESESDEHFFLGSRKDWPTYQCKNATLPPLLPWFHGSMDFDPRLGTENMWKLSIGCCFQHPWQLSLYKDQFLLYSFLPLIVDVVFILLGFQLAMCGCAQGLRRDSRIGAENAGRVVLLVISLYIVYKWRQMFWFILASSDRVYTALALVVQVKLLSWTGATCMNFLFFCVAFKYQSPESPWRKPSCLAKMLNPAFNITASEYVDFVNAQKQSDEDTSVAFMDH